MTADEPDPTAPTCGICARPVPEDQRRSGRHRLREALPPQLRDELNDMSRNLLSAMEA
ncbi:hypothetical protein NKH77_23635 [Streptomyces sp. M19]